MKAKGLQLGDWVLYHSRPARVRNIHDNVLIDGDDELVDLVFPDRTTMPQVDPIHLEPIPLTAEILEKNGFHYTNQHTLQTSETYMFRLEQRGFDFTITIKLNDYFALDSYDDRMYRLAEISTGRWCVHQLQHTLHLCGIEKEITL